MSSYSIYWAQRDREVGRTYMRAVAISGASHLAILLVLLLADYLHRAPRLDDKSIPVRFVTAPRARKPAAAKATPAPAPAKEAAPAPKPEPKVISKPELKPAPEKKKEVAKKEEPKKKEPPKPEPAPPKEPPTPALPDDKAADIELARNMVGQDAAGDEEAQWAEAMEGIEGDIRMMNYREEVSSAIREAWVLPVSVPMNKDLHFDVLFQVDAAGNVLSYKVLHTSGHAEMDRSVQMLLSQLKKLPPLPYSPAGGYQEIPVRFVPEEPW